MNLVVVHSVFADGPILLSTPSLLVGKSCSAPFPFLLMDQSLLSTLKSADEPILLSTAVALLLLSVVHAGDAASCQLIMQVTLLIVS